MNQWLQTHIEFLKGVGPQRAKLLRDELGIATYHDLLYHFPFRYIDRSQFHLIKDIPQIDGYVQLKGQIISVSETGSGRQKRITVKFQDNTGMIDLLWFQGYKYILPNLKLNTTYIVFGKAKPYVNTWNISHPELSQATGNEASMGWQPVYSSTEKLTASGLHSKGLQKLIEGLLDLSYKVYFEETIPPKLIRELNLTAFGEAIRAIHMTADVELAQ